MTAPAEAAREALAHLLADHPMWIGEGGRPHLPEREARIAQFVEDAESIFTAFEAAVRVQVAGEIAQELEDGAKSGIRQGGEFRDGLRVAARIARRAAGSAASPVPAEPVMGELDGVTGRYPCGCRWVNVPDGSGGGDGEFQPCQTHAGPTTPYERCESAPIAGPSRLCTGCEDWPPMPEIVVLCGSTKFRAEFERASRELGLQGKIVLSVSMFGHSGDLPPEACTDGHPTKTALDELHKRKIDLADSVLVINPGGYIGTSTRSEIEYAERHGKRIAYLVEPSAVPGQAAEPNRRQHDERCGRPGPCLNRRCRCWCHSPDEPSPAVPGQELETEAYIVTTNRRTYRGRRIEGGWEIPVPFARSFTVADAQVAVVRPVPGQEQP